MFEDIFDNSDKIEEVNPEDPIEMPDEWDTELVEKKPDVWNTGKDVWSVG